MAAIDIAQLYAPPAAVARRRDDRAVAGRRDERSVPVNAIEATYKINAPRIELPTEGDLEPYFSGPIVLEVSPGRANEVAVPGVGQETWREIQVRCQDKALISTPPLPFAVVASYPYSTDWVEAARFKRSKHRSDADMEELRREALASGNARVQRIRAHERDASRNHATSNAQL